MSDLPQDTLEWLKAELDDELDEDVELELSEPALSLELRKIYKKAHPETIDRRTYFLALIELQAELIKLQDWVEHTGEKVVVLFEGRDSAGKWSRWPSPPSGKRPSGISSATCRTCPRPARSCCSIAPGTTAPVSSA